MRCGFPAWRHKKMLFAGTILVTKGHAGKIAAIFKVAQSRTDRSMSRSSPSFMLPITLKRALEVQRYTAAQKYAVQVVAAERCK